VAGGLVAAADSGCTLVERVRVGLVGVGVRGELLLVGKELLVGDGGESGGLVDDRCLVDFLVDGVGVVDNGWCDGLTLDDWLD
jgi:hypothetical protein